MWSLALMERRQGTATLLFSDFLTVSELSIITEAKL